MIIPQSPFRKFTALSFGLLLASASAASGAIVIQELFDGIAGDPPGTDSTLDGKGDTTTTIGLTGLWQVIGGNTGIFTASNFNSGAGLPGLPSNGGVLGGVWNNTKAYDTNIYAFRPLATPIDFSKDQVLYYSFIADNGGDVAMGIGFSVGFDAETLDFVGAGLSWNNARAIDTGELDSGNAAYACYGLLDADNGPYGVRQHEPMNSVNGAALVVVRLTISSTQPDKIDIKRYGVGDTIESDPSLVTWSVSDSIDTSITATQLLLWINGVSGNLAGELDAIRVGTTWADVTGASATTDPFTAWASGAPNNLTGADALPAADPDHDGIPNAIEFITGSSPITVNDRSKLPAGAVVAGNFEFTFHRADIANAAPLPFVEYGSDLTGWTKAQDGVNGVSVVATDDFYGTGVDRVVVKIPQALANGSRLFARLNANR